MVFCLKMVGSVFYNNKINQLTTMYVGMTEWNNKKTERIYKSE